MAFLLGVGLGEGYWSFASIFWVIIKTHYFWGSIKILGILGGVGVVRIGVRFF